MGARRLRGFVFVLLATPACSEDATANPPPPDPPNDGRKSAAHATEVSCASMPEASGDGCAIEAGTGGELFLRGVVLTESEIIRGGGVLLDAAGAIACVGCDCAELAASATTVTCPNSVISPGLVNTHDHLSFVHDWPHPDDGERFEHRHDWRRGLHGHSRLEASDGATTPQLQWGELRFVFGGATSTIGGSGTPGFLRNLEYAPNSEGLGERSISLSTFPLGDGEEGRQLDTGCAYPAMPSREAITLARSYVMHVAEGVDAFARNEFECLSGEGGADLMAPEVSIVHGLALGAPDLARMAAAGAQLVWSPRSNVALYGDTARVTIAATLGVSIALGTDWIYTGSTNVLRELACADSLNSAKFGRFFSDFELWSMVTTNAAKSAGALDVIGTLAPGRRADIAIFDASGRDAHRAVIEAAPSDVQLVLRDGKPLYGDAALMGALVAGACSDLDVCGSAKQVCTPLGGFTFDDLAAANADLYPPFYCGVPEGEPTCTPQRSTSIAGSSTYDGVPTDADADSDGIDDEDDTCPAVFDPIRPVDEGAQPDTDGDGTGDACDSTPL